MDSASSAPNSPFSNQSSPAISHGPIDASPSVSASATTASATANPVQAQDPLSDHELPIAEPNFTWGKKDARPFTNELDRTYERIVHWKRNLFRVPQGNAGKQFVAELAKLYEAFAAGSALESVALKAAIIMPHLLLQKPHQKSKTKEHITSLKRRLELWKDGDLASLLKEASTAQHRLEKSF